MNATRWILAGLLGGCMTLSVGAQPPPQEESPPEFEREQRGRRSLATWMSRFQEEDPEEFRRLQTLREENPQQFEKELRKRLGKLQERQLKAVMEEFPRFRDFMEQLPEDERQRLTRRLMRPSPRSGLQARRDNPDAQPRGKDKEVRELARAYREAGPDGQEEIRSQLRNLLETQFERTEAERRKQLEHAEGGIERLKKMVEFRAENRKQIIDRRLMELTEGDPMAF